MDALNFPQCSVWAGATDEPLLPARTAPADAEAAGAYFVEVFFPEPIDPLDELLDAEPLPCKVAFHWRPRRRIPEDDEFFENVWRDLRTNGNVY